MARGGKIVSLDSNVHASARKMGCGWPYVGVVGWCSDGDGDGAGDVDRDGRGGGGSLVEWNVGWLHDCHPR